MSKGWIFGRHVSTPAEPKATIHENNPPPPTRNTVMTPAITSPIPTGASPFSSAVCQRLPRCRFQISATP
jgi:hypothetical protein